jgi:hypothetical protein
LRGGIVGDQIVGTNAGESRNIGASAAHDPIVAGTADQRIVSATAVQNIGDHIAGNGVIA